VLLTERTGCLPEGCHIRRKSLNPASGGYCKRLVAGSQEGEEQKVGKEAEGT